MFVNKELARKIGNSIGKFIDTDLATEGHKWRKALRIRIEASVAEPLKDHTIFNYQENKRIILEIRYERLGDFYHVCGVVGHKLSSCQAKPNQIEPTPDPFKFGPWLKAENNTIPNPFIPIYKSTLQPSKYHLPFPTNDQSETNHIGKLVRGIPQEPMSEKPKFPKTVTFQKSQKDLYTLAKKWKGLVLLGLT
ncbi:hypothetical protein Sango_1723100 [Sesamum angolense]|uniref:Zinc knuckle CX2CX4HX4C domain-containing protein n=1 Tax=Sesamum angolense TaxID=2727404 RepID=A0AAE2BS85_9LAMI|nr:hypothetical protein Sango_1723100 [Sesamum angolense]